MMCFKSAEQILYPIPQVERWRGDVPEGYQWVHNRPVAVVHIDLDEDDYQEMVRKLDRWERLERRRSLAEVTGASPARIAPA
jgi:hypothetical protein